MGMRETCEIKKKWRKRHKGGKLKKKKYLNLKDFNSRRLFMEIRGILIGNDKNKKEEIENVRRNWKVWGRFLG
jgi:hypothetical protein